MYDLPVGGTSPPGVGIGPVKVPVVAASSTTTLSCSITDRTTNAMSGNAEKNTAATASSAGRPRMGSGVSGMVYVASSANIAAQVPGS